MPLMYVHMYARRISLDTKKTNIKFQVILECYAPMISNMQATISVSMPQLNWACYIFNEHTCVCSYS